MSNQLYAKGTTQVTPRGKVQWVQCVASKSGGAAHMVRCFEGGLVTCTCQGFNWRGTCSHIATGKLQEAREAMAAAIIEAPVIVPTSGAELARKAEIARKGAAAMADLFPEMVAA